MSPLPEYRKSPRLRRDTYSRKMCKRLDGEFYVFAVNMRNRPTRATVELVAADPKGPFTVLGEDRSVEISENRFEDEFEGYEVHLYRAAEK